MNFRSPPVTTIAMVLVATIFLSGCFSSVPKRHPEFAPVAPAAMRPPQPHNGAIYQAGYGIALFEDLKARRVGDILTIQLEEETEAEKEATTNIDKSNATVISTPSLLGSALQFNAPGLIPLASNKNNTLEANLSSSNDFEGEGDSSQSNKLEGEISVMVVDVLPNGNLIVRGEKRLAINQGNEYVRLSGIIRPMDIDANNTVSSTKVADATLYYVGDGAVADGNRMGWLARFFVSAIWPF